jgi:hypothetical protein
MVILLSSYFSRRLTKEESLIKVPYPKKNSNLNLINLGKTRYEWQKRNFLSFLNLPNLETSGYESNFGFIKKKLIFDC